MDTKLVPIEQQSGFSIEELIKIDKYLSKFQSIKGTGLTFQITKNILKIDSVKKSYIKKLNILDEKFCVKDEKGVAVKFKIQEFSHPPVYLKDEQDNYIIASSNESSFKRIEDCEEYKDALTSINEEKYAIKFHGILESTIESLMEKEGPLEGIDLAPLFGNIIVESLT